jgi:hypothetical protein
MKFSDAEMIRCLHLTARELLEAPKDKVLKSKQVQILRMHLSGALC